MMILPLLIIVLLPKVVNTNDPEMRKVGACQYLVVVNHVLSLRHTTQNNKTVGRVHELCLRELHLHLLWSQEIEQSMNMLSPNPELPDMSELVTKFFSGSKGSSKAGGSSKGTRPAVKRR